MNASLTQRLAEPCEHCGIRHCDPIEELAVGHGALESMGRFIDGRGWQRLVVVCDVNTGEILGDEVAKQLRSGGHEVHLLTFEQSSGLLADEVSATRVESAIAYHQAQAAVAVGSGTLNDITRYATHAAKVPYVSVPTAASMDGYASGVAAMQFGGVKVSFPAHTPLGIFADLEVLVAAPKEMTTWGLGDLLGKATARFDWLLAEAVTGEVFCPAVESRVLVPLTRCIEDARSLLAGEEAGVEALLMGLVQSGIAMAMMGSSRPASGCEHHASHFWDLLAFRGLRAHGPHGLQVAYATRFAMAVQRRCLDRLGDPLLRASGSPRDGGSPRDEAAWFGDLADSETLRLVREDKQAAFERFGSSWPPPGGTDSAGRRLGGALGLHGGVSGALDAAGIPAGPGFLQVDPPTLRATLRYANRLRARFTALDFLESQGHLGEIVDEIVDALPSA